MSNEQFKINYNESKILDTLSRNLNIDFVANGSNIHKIATAYKEESNAFASFVNSSIDNVFINSMSDAALETFGNSIGVTRKRYSSVKLFKEDTAVYVTVVTGDTLVSSFNSTRIFNKNDIIYTDDSIDIKVLSDVYVDTLNALTYIPVNITSSTIDDSYVITKGSTYKISPTQDGKDILPIVSLVIDRTVGLTISEEDISDYRLKILSSLYQANNGANSVINTIINETPFLYSLETEDINSRSIKNIYPYTESLLINGSDDYLSRVSIPAIETLLNSRLLYRSNISVYEPKPIPFYVQIVLPSNSSYIGFNFSDIVDTFNTTMYTQKTISRSDIITFITSNTSLTKEDMINTNIYFTSQYVSEEQYKLPDDTITIPVGRFINMTRIIGSTN